MPIRKYKPTTPGRRGSSVADFAEVTRSTPEKSLVVPSPKTGGRNNTGRITTRHIGGGHKQAYRLVDFKRYDKDGVPAKVAQIEYDPNRTARIALLHFADGEKRYIIAPVGHGRPQPVEGQAPLRPRRGDEPDRPPARWWRGQDLGWPPPGVTVGPAGGPDPGQEKAEQPDDRPSPQDRQEALSRREATTCHAA